VDVGDHAVFSDGGHRPRLRGGANASSRAGPRSSGGTKPFVKTPEVPAGDSKRTGSGRPGRIHGRGQGRCTVEGPNRTYGPLPTIRKAVGGSRRLTSRNSSRGDPEEADGRDRPPDQGDKRGC